MWHGSVWGKACARATIISTSIRLRPVHTRFCSMSWDSLVLRVNKTISYKFHDKINLDSYLRLCFKSSKSCTTDEVPLPKKPVNTNLLDAMFLCSIWACTPCIYFKLACQPFSIPMRLADKIWFYLLIITTNIRLIFVLHYLLHKTQADCIYGELYQQANFLYIHIFCVSVKVFFGFFGTTGLVINFGRDKCRPSFISIAYAYAARHKIMGSRGRLYTHFAYLLLR